MPYFRELYDHYEVSFDPMLVLKNGVWLFPRHNWVITKTVYHTELPFRWISEVEAQKGKELIIVNLDKWLYGKPGFVKDFLEAYQDRIKVWCPDEI
jgi:hypothetical protein